ncbi:MAG: hypothetical protein F2911_07585 [Actinobacteria bacterium]|uniref:Unannotated protein n=1 Tax=freshwater metagenome TaxID=449393 RepID=A0A6J7S5J5_9ZZZZ|nr:hypothetical protein [Actinomycetota bacterium]
MSAATVVSASDRTTIHASFFSLTCGALGMLGVAVGTFISPGSSGTFGWALHAGGWILVSVAIIAHIEHLSNRLGRVAVICGILAAVGQGLADLPFAINSTWVSDTGWINYFNAMWAAASLLAAASIGLAAVRKEKQMEAHLASGRPGMYASEDYSTTVHASFLSLVTGAVGALLTGIASLMLIGGGGPATRLSWILYAIGSVLLAAAIIAHIEHLSLSLGRPAVILGSLAMILNAVSALPGVFDPAGSNTLDTTLIWLLFAGSATIAAIAIGLVAVRRRAQG